MQNNKMVSPKVLNLILALQVLTTLVMYVNALPITSKPIESTAENLAWQAWLMLPPEQKNLEKSRKVTPKSIFTLPFRECPPGHHLFENRCIPKVQIDQTALLTQELLGLVGGDDGGDDNNYDTFDYDDVDMGDEIVAEVMYEPAQKLNGDSNNESNNDTAIYDDHQLPSQDEPLKFNIFQQKFPTDYESEPIPSEEDGEQQKQEQQQMLAAKSNNSTTNSTQTGAINSLANGEGKSKQHSNSSNVNNNVDLQMESSNVSTNIALQPGPVALIVTPTTTFAISDIDAISLPAAAAAAPATTTLQRGNNNGNVHVNVDANVNTNADYLEMKKQNIHKFSLFKDDSHVQLVTSSLLNDQQHSNNNENRKQQPDFTQLLKADDLLPLPLPLPNVAPLSATTTTRTTKTTATASGNTDNEVPTLSTSFIGGSTTTLLGSRSSSVGDASSSAYNDEVTDMMLSDIDATMPTIPKEIDYTKKEKFAKKEEHPRSVIDDLETEAQESNFMTTTEADGTTNFQLDETTILETHDAPTIALKELMELALAPQPMADDDEQGGVVVKKSKVEPVPELPSIVEQKTYSTETTSTLMPTIIITTDPTTTISASKVSASTAQPSTTTSTTSKLLLMTPTVTPSLEVATSIKTTDRFDNYQHKKQQKQQQEISTKNGELKNKKNQNDGNEDDKLNFSNTEPTTTKTTTTKMKTVTAAAATKIFAKTSEIAAIDEQQKSRMINELVKGNKKANNKKINENKINEHQQQLKAEAVIKPTAKATSEAESGTVTIKTTATRSALKETTKESSISPETTTAVSPKTMTTTTKIQSTSATEPTPSPTSTIWSKIMPLLGFGGDTVSSSSITESTADETTNIVTTTTPKTISKSNLNTSFSNNRSNRNSKIIRINSLSTFSTSTNSKAYQITPNSSNSSSSKQQQQTADKLALSSPQSSQTTTTTTETPTTTETAEISDSSSSSSGSISIRDSSGFDDEAVDTSTTFDGDSDQGEPFWWLPIGWRLDRANEPSLLLRFWSALPGQGD